MNTNFSMTLSSRALRQVLKPMLQIKSDKSEEGNPNPLPFNVVQMSFSGDTLRISMLGTGGLRMTTTLVGTSALSSPVDTIIYVSKQKLMSVLKVCKSEMLNLSGNEAQITITEENDAFYRLKCTETMFPEPPQMDDVVADFTLPESSSSYISSVACFAASKDEYRPAMQGLLMESDGNGNICAVSTDGYRLVSLKIPVSTQKHLNVIIPIAAVQLAASKSDVRVVVGEVFAQFFLDDGKTEITVRTIPERFPPWQSVMPTSQKYSATVNLVSFIAALKSVAVCADKQTNEMVCTFANDAITLTTTSDEADARQVVSAQYAGEEMAIKVNYTYAKDVLEHLRKMGVSEAVISFSEPRKAVIVRNAVVSEGACEATMLIMPMRM